jgi:uncharacterized membrane protein
MLPPIPTWDGLHPLVVHFPIALLLTAPVLIAMALVWRRHEFPLAAAALVIMGLGTLSAFVAVQSGEAAQGLLETPQAEAVFNRHEELAKLTQGLFAGLTVLFAAIVFVPRMIRRPLRRPATVVAGLVFLALYLCATVVLANTAHQGGRLVHELGVHNPAAAGAAEVAVASDGG